MNFGETTVLGGAGGAIGETTVLGASSAKAAPQPRQMLLRLKNNERINIDKPVYRIGKERSYVDYFIGDNSAISRSHANIITRDGKYFVMDTNSTNHTFVNGSMIQSNVEVPLEHGTMLRLADEEFEFKLF
jgi:pSer/pThr/pTyr-binding forkhead associated (FHA) protein